MYTQQALSKLQGRCGDLNVLWRAAAICFSTVSDNTVYDYMDIYINTELMFILLHNRKGSWIQVRWFANDSTKWLVESFAAGLISY